MKIKKLTKSQEELIKIAKKFVPTKGKKRSILINSVTGDMEVNTK